MTLYRRGKVWWVEYQVDGVRHRQSTHTRKYAVAKAWAAQIDTARKMPTFEEAVTVLKMFYRRPAEGVLPIDSAWEVYIDLARATGKASISEYTLHRRKIVLQRFLAWLAKHRATIKTIEGVTGPVAAGFATYLAHDLQLKTKTRINNLAELNTVWKMLEHAATGIRNPWAALRPQDVDGKVGKAFSRADEARVLDAARRVGKDWLPICTIMRHTGQRYGDVARLTWANIDGDVLRITPHKTTRHKIAVAIPITQPIRAALDAITRTGDYLFPLHAELYGTGAARHTLAFREVLVAAGLEDAGYTVHSWRHTAATRLAESGADIETRKALLGHRVDATAERYDHDDHIAAKRAALERAAN